MGCPHPDYLPEELTVTQLNDWDLYYEQVGSRLEWCFAMLLSLTYNINRGKGKPTKDPDKFIIGYDHTKPLPDKDTFLAQWDNMMTKRKKQ